MPIVQDSYYISDDDIIRLMNGLYQRSGSVIRHATGPNRGQIVKFLQPIDLKELEQAQDLGVKALQFVQQHKKGIGVTVSISIVASIGIWGYNKWKNHEQKVLNKFCIALQVYIEAIRTGNMDIDKIDNLMKTLQELKEHKNYDKISIQFTIEELEVLVSCIYEYTVKLVSDNAVELMDDELCVSGKENSNVVVNLQKYLKIQKKIFEVVA